MANGFTSPGSFNNNRKASSFFGSPYSNAPYYNAVYKTPATQSATAYALLQNGNGYASRINKYNVVTFALKKLVCEARNIY
jgi:hypothetical protein